MRTYSRPRGATLIEAMAAMSVLLLGSLGVATLHVEGVKVEGDSRRLTRSTALAEDMLAQIEQWPIDDPRLTNDAPGNDAKFGDRGDPTLLDTEDPVADLEADHGEADLVKDGTTWNGLPAAALGGVYQRYWNVAAPDDSNGNGVPDAARVAVIVRWRNGGGWRRVVLLLNKPNPAEAL